MRSFLYSGRPLALFFGVFLALSAQVACEPVVLRVQCGNEQSRVTSTRLFCSDNGMSEDECEGLLGTVEHRCLSWTDEKSEFIMELPIEFERTPTCIFSITVDDTDVCIVSSAEAAGKTFKDAATTGRAFCQKYDFNEETCLVLVQALEPVMANISANRISKKSAESGVHNHDGSVPYIKHALGYEMDRWRVENGFYGLETGGAGARPPACTASLGTLEVVASGGKGEPERRQYVGTRVRLKFAGGNSPNAGAYVCMHMHPPRHLNLYPSKGIDLGCLNSWERSSFEVENAPYGEFDIYAYVLGTSEDPFSSPSECAAVVMVHVLPLLIGDGRQYVAETAPCAPHPLMKKSVGALDAVPRAEDPEFSICILAHRGQKALRKALDSWQSSGLLSMAKERILLMQELKDHDHRLYDNLADVYSLQLLDERLQLGIAVGLSRLVERAGTELILFLEEDFRVSDSVKGVNEVRVAIREAADLVQTARADVVRLRHVVQPGVPMCAYAWRSSEDLLGKGSTPKRNNQSVLDLRAWVEDLPAAFPDSSWYCGHARKHACAFSTHASWTNNPIFFSRMWFLENISPVAYADKTTRLEAAVSFSNPFWSDRCFIVAKGQGLFTHDDVDKPHWQQTVCPGPPPRGEDGGA
jgi:hypothetical protein